MELADGDSSPALSGLRPARQPTALVTGGSSGIGLAIARVLAREGYALTLAARSHDPLAAAAAALRSAGASVHYVCADVTSAADVHRLAVAHRARWRELDLLVNSAGAVALAPVDDTTPEIAATCYAVNALAPIAVYHECRDMLRGAADLAGSALVVNVASIVARTPAPLAAAYAASKAALVAWTLALNNELSLSGIKAVALCPALVDTPLTADDPVPSSQMLLPADVAEALPFLLRVSPRCVIPEIYFQRAGRGDPT